MSPVAGLINVFGVRPWLAARLGAWLMALSAWAAGVSSTASGRARPEVMSRPLTWLGVRFGLSSSSSATVPETTGAAIEVPPARMYWPSTIQVGHMAVKALAGARFETIAEPGA